jgi:hypothetical protein
MPRASGARRIDADDPQRSLAAKFAVMHNTAQTGMMRSAEPGQNDERALQSRRQSR